MEERVYHPRAPMVLDIHAVVPLGLDKTIVAHLSPALPIHATTGLYARKTSGIRWPTHVVPVLPDSRAKIVSVLPMVQHLHPELHVTV